MKSSNSIRAASKSAQVLAFLMIHKISQNISRHGIMHTPLYLRKRIVRKHTVINLQRV
jgi:hypothetical protein